MIATHRDYTAQYTANAGVLNLDISGYDYVIVHFIGLSGAINFFGSNDSGGVTGITDGNATSVLNPVSIQGVNQTTGTAGTSAATGTIYKFSSPAKYLQLNGGAVTATKILVYLAKIQ